MARSKAYPVIDLKQAVETSHSVIEQLGKGNHDRDALAQAMGYSKGQGLVARKVAALVQYGLLELSNGSYSPTKLAQTLMHPVDDNERSQALRQSFGLPTLFSELLEKYATQGRIPSALPNILVREHGITSKAAEHAASMFKQSGVFAGVLDTEGRFARGRSPEGEVQEREPPEDDQAERPAESPKLEISARAGKAASATQSFRLALSSGEARLEIPDKLTSHDVRKLKKLVELIELGLEPDE